MTLFLRVGIAETKRKEREETDCPYKENFFSYLSVCFSSSLLCEADECIKGETRVETLCSFANYGSRKLSKSLRGLFNDSSVRVGQEKIETSSRGTWTPLGDVGRIETSLDQLIRATRTREPLSENPDFAKFLESYKYDPVVEQAAFWFVDQGLTEWTDLPPNSEMKLTSLSPNTILEYSRILKRFTDWALEEDLYPSDHATIEKYLFKLYKEDKRKSTPFAFRSAFRKAAEAAGKDDPFHKSSRLLFKAFVADQPQLQKRFIPPEHLQLLRNVFISKTCPREKQAAPFV